MKLFNQKLLRVYHDIRFIYLSIFAKISEERVSTHEGIHRGFEWLVYLRSIIISIYNIPLIQLALRSFVTTMNGIDRIIAIKGDCKLPNLGISTIDRQDRARRDQRVHRNRPPVLRCPAINENFPIKKHWFWLNFYSFMILLTDETFFSIDNSV